VEEWVMDHIPGARLPGMSTQEMQSRVASAAVGVFTGQQNISSALQQSEAELIYLAAKAATDELVNKYSDRMERIFIAVVVTTVLSWAMMLWFIYVLRLAYRKQMIELLLSSPHFQFSFEAYSVGRDKYMVGTVAVSLIIGFIWVHILFLVVGAILCTDVFWEEIWNNYLDEIIALTVYEIFLLVVIPKVHDKCVFGPGESLLHPRKQAVFVFLFEIFYMPQVAVTVCLKLVYAPVISLLMFLRPDLQLLPGQFSWLDGTHAAYVAAVHEHILMCQLQQPTEEEEGMSPPSNPKIGGDEILPEDAKISIEIGITAPRKSVEGPGSKVSDPEKME
jgi:hypothetical protein